MSRKQSPVSVPEGLDKVLLHACCAPCSSAIVEWMLENGIRPVIFYYNPNIYPQKEYMIRKDESKRHADMVGVEWIDGDYDHDRWLDCVSGLEVKRFDIASIDELAVAVCGLVVVEAVLDGDEVLLEGLDVLPDLLRVLTLADAGDEGCDLLHVALLICSWRWGPGGRCRRPRPFPSCPC